MLQKFEDAAKEIKRKDKKYVDRSLLLKETKEIVRNVPEMKEHSDKQATRGMKKMGILMLNTKQSLPKAADHVNEYVQTVQAQQPPKAVCCNCQLKNYVDPFQEVNVSGYVLCQNCENVYRESSPQRLDSATKTVDFCVPVPRGIASKQKIAMQREICEQIKVKRCACFEKSRPRDAETNRQNYVGKKNTIRSKDLELVCCQCDCPYLKIASSDDRNTRPRARKKSSNMLKEQNTDHVSKCPMTRKQRSNGVRDTENRCCTCEENKIPVSKRDLARALHSLGIKRPNDAGNKNVNEIPKENRRDNGDTARSVPETTFNEESKGNVSRTCFHDDTGNERAVTRVKRLTKNPVQRRRFYIVSDDAPVAEGKRDTPKQDYRSGRVRYKVGKGKEKIKARNTGTSNIADEKYEVKRSHTRTDKSLRYSVLDSSQNADVSDNCANVEVNVTPKQSFEVTSISFIRQLNNAIPVTELYRRRRCPRKGHRVICKTKDLERISRIENKTMIDRENSGIANDRKNERFPMEYRNNIRATGQTAQLMNPSKNRNARESRRSKTLRQKLY